MARKLSAVGLLLMLTGCIGTAAVQTVHTAVGPVGQCLVVRQYAATSDLAKYKEVEVVKFENTLPVAIKESVVDAVQAGIVTELRDYREVTGVTAVDRYQRGAPTTPTLVIMGSLLDITSDTIPGQKLLGEANHLIARVKLVDKATGTVLLEANLRGYVKSAVDFKQEHLGKGVGRGAAELMEKVFGWKRKGMFES